MSIVKYEPAGVDDASGLNDAARQRLAELARAHKSVLEVVARRLCRNGHDAEDLVQDALERAVRNADKLTDGAGARAWLITVMHNLYIDRCRRAGRRPEHQPLDEDRQGSAPEPAKPPAWGDITVDDLRAALHELPAELRRAYELHAFERRSYEAIAKALKIPKSTVGTRLLRARRKLREVLARQHPVRDREEGSA